MYSTDLVKTLEMIRLNERSRLLSFLELSEDSRKESADLVLHLYGFLDKQEEQKMTKESVYALLFPDEEPVKNKLEKLMSDTLQVVRQFIALEVVRTEMGEMEQLVNLQKFYNERNQEKYFRQARNQFNRLKENKRNWHPKDLFQMFLSEAEEFAFQNVQNRKKDDLNLRATLHALNEYFVAEHLRYTCMLLNQNQLASLSLPPLKDLLPYDPNNTQLAPFFQKPFCLLYMKAVELFSEEIGNAEEKLKDFFQTLVSCEDQIPLEFVNSLEIFACNFGIRQADKGQASFRRLIFQVQKRRVESGRVYLEKKIKASEFHSIVVTGLRLGENAWVKQFIENHRDRITGAMPSQDYYQFNLTYYFFQTKEYEPELQTLLTSNYEDMAYKILGKILEIKILYEMSHRPESDHRVAEFLENKIEAAIIFFFREKNVPPEKKKMGKRFADKMKGIVHAESKGDAKRLVKIREEVVGFDLIADRQWLQQIIDDLLKRLEKGGKN